jgi:hypothetical protein
MTRHKSNTTTTIHSTLGCFGGSCCGALQQQPCNHGPVQSTASPFWEPGVQKGPFLESARICPYLSLVFVYSKMISEQPCSNGEPTRYTVLWEGILQSVFPPWKIGWISWTCSQKCLWRSPTCENWYLKLWLHFLDNLVPIPVGSSPTRQICHSASGLILTQRWIVV